MVKQKQRWHKTHVATSTFRDRSVADKRSHSKVCNEPDFPVTVTWKQRSYCFQ